MVLPYIDFGVNPLDYIVTGNVGAEYSWKNICFLRLGTHLSHDTASHTAGAGVKIGNIYIDYAFASYSVLEDTHQFGFRFGFEFGLAEGDQKFF